MKSFFLFLFTVTLSVTACIKKNEHSVVVTFAGSGVIGATNGSGINATFSNLMGVTADSAGNIYVADSHNNLIRKVNPDGAVTTLAGSGKQGTIDGQGTTASFFNPGALCVDKNGNVYVADTQNNLIRKISPDGVVTTVAGKTEKNEEYGGKFPVFDNPGGIAADGAGNIYVADSYHNKIRKIDVAGKISVVAGNIEHGAKDGTGGAASFYIPQGIVFDSKGNLYVADTFNNMIRKITPAGVVTTLAGKVKKGHSDGKGLAASFLHPYGLGIDKTDNIYVADSGNNLIRKISPDGTVITIAGNQTRGSNNGDVKQASFFKPMGVTVDQQGSLFIADFENNMVRKIIN